MKRVIQHILSRTLWTIVGIYAVLMVSVRIPSVQHYLSQTVEDTLAQTLDTKVKVGCVDLGFLNRIMVDGLVVYDKHNKLMLKASRVSVSVNVIDILSGRINITSAQLFGLMADVYKQNPNVPYNCQFVIDALSSKDTTSTSHIDLQIASLVIRNGEVRHNVLSAPCKEGRFDVNHLKVSKLSGHFILYELTDNSVNLNVKHLSFEEACGLSLKDMQLIAQADTSRFLLKKMVVKLPHSQVSVPDITAYFNLQTRKLNAFQGEMSLQLNLQDIAPLLPFDASAFPEISGRARVKSTSNKSRLVLALESSDNSFALNANARCDDFQSSPKWNVDKLSVTATPQLLSALNNAFAIPDPVKALGSVNILASGYGTMHTSNVTASVVSSECGAAKLSAIYADEKVHLTLSTSGWDVAKMLPESKLGVVSTVVKADYRNAEQFSVTADVSRLEYSKYTYGNINVNGEYNKGKASVNIDVIDPHLNISLNARANVASAIKSLSADFTVGMFSPKILGITDKLNDARFSLRGNVDMSGSNIDNLVGNLSLHDIYMTGGLHADKDETAPLPPLTMQRLDLLSELTDGYRSVILSCDDASLSVKGHFTPSQVPDLFGNILARQLPSVISEKSIPHSDLTLNTRISSTRWLQRLIGLDVELQKPLKMHAFVNTFPEDVSIYCDAPSVTAFGQKAENLMLMLWKPDSTLSTSLKLDLCGANGNTSIALLAGTSVDEVQTSVSWNGGTSEKPFRGELNTSSLFHKTLAGYPLARISITPSHVLLGDSIWRLHSQDIVYNEGRLHVNNFAFENDNQHVYVDGIASESINDTLAVDLKDVDVSYIMNIVNFHSVEFGGFATGHLAGHSLMSSSPEASGYLDVRNFLFENGRMGDLHIDVALNNDARQLDLTAVGRDETGRRCISIDGQVSPQRSDIDLNIKTEGERMDFLQEYCRSFMKDIDAYATGSLRLYGPFSKLNLVGRMVADGSFTVTPLNCRYRLINDTVDLVVDDIKLHNQPLYDMYGNVAYISGGLHHRNLGRMTYDFDIDARKFLGYDVRELGESTFCGTAFLSGNCNIKGRSSELDISVTGDVEPGSRMVYDASSPDAITQHEFVTWHSADNHHTQLAKDEQQNKEDDDDVTTSMHLNLLLNVTPSATLHLLMDKISGDYIDLHGNGSLTANWYNKGAFRLNGNFEIASGTYKMSLQNIIRRDFSFMPGGSIQFDGDPYFAKLNLQAKYEVKSVSLSDLNIGNSFSSNNIRVDCLMDITGTPAAPRVSFSLDPHTNNTEVKNMIYSLINGEEEMNQQVLYLLSVGRFYAQTGNNAGLQDNRNSSQTTLAMQSILSGTISQQFSRLMGNVVNSNNWNVGANISPGDEGMTNAEYEGLLNGSLFNNRLLFNGQFGYRNNATTSTQGFIGDFDLRYLLVPSGNLAVRAFNQTNDRYFTKNSLNTQGLGLIIKKDFNSLRGLFGKKK